MYVCLSMICPATVPTMRWEKRLRLLDPGKSLPSQYRTFELTIRVNQHATQSESDVTLPYYL